jgi:hypothetical protein
MKLIALRKFHNAASLNLEITEKTPNFEHELEVPKGHRFNIGGDFKTIKAMEQARDPLVESVKDLVRSKAAVIDDGTPEVQDVVKQVDVEVKQEAAARKAATKAAPPATA